MRRRMRDLTEILIIEEMLLGVIFLKTLRDIPDGCRGELWLNRYFLIYDDIMRGDGNIPVPAAVYLIRDDDVAKLSLFDFLYKLFN